MTTLDLFSASLGWAALCVAIEAYLGEFCWKEEYATKAIDYSAMGNTGHAAAQVGRFVDLLVERLRADLALV